MKLNGTMDSPIGKIGIKLQGLAISELVLTPEHFENVHEQNNIQSAVNALKTYFSNPTYIFDLNLKPAGTDFQKRVWHALCQIPAGTTLTYGELAKTLNSSPRAVGQACKRNPIPIIIPCHRVTSKARLGGYMGQTTGAIAEIKQWLLRHESRSISKER